MRNSFNSLKRILIQQGGVFYYVYLNVNKLRKKIFEKYDDYEYERSYDKYGLGIAMKPGKRNI